MSPRKFAVFDIDGTLVRWQFFHAVVHELGVSGHLDRATHRKIHDARMQWKRREPNYSFRDYESVLVHSYLDSLKDISEVDHRAVIDAVFEQYQDQLFTYTRDLLRRLKQEGYIILAISGSHEDILELLAQKFGIDAFVGAHFELQNGRYTGRGSTPVHDKAGTLRDMVEVNNLAYEGSIGIGDSESDIPMLEIVEHPIAFNPAKGLYEHAKQQGWDIVIERKNVIYTLKKSDTGVYELTE